MCELFGLTGDRKTRINELLKTFFSHSVKHQNGWGIAVTDTKPVLIEKEARKAYESEYLKTLLEKDISVCGCIAHIRRASIGEENILNTHPFETADSSGRQWILAHNGTIFESPALKPYQYRQKGATDSERILLYLVDLAGSCKHAETRFKALEEGIKTISVGNKTNLLIFDGEYFYVHKNHAGSLHQKEGTGTVIFSTQPLEEEGWQETEGNRLLVYKRGELVYKGAVHENTYIYDEEKMKHIYLAYSGL